MKKPENKVPDDLLAYYASSSTISKYINQMAQELLELRLIKEKIKSISETVENLGTMACQDGKVIIDFSGQGDAMQVYDALGDLLFKDQL